MSVCGTGTIEICLADFLGSLLRFTICSAEASQYCQRSAPPTDFPVSGIPTAFNPVFRLRAELSLLLLLLALYGSTGILTRRPSATPFGLALGPDLPAVD